MYMSDDDIRLDLSMYAQLGIQNTDAQENCYICETHY